MSGTLPLIMTTAGAQPTAVTTLNSTLISNAEALAPGLTTDLPGSMVEDIASTGTGALIVADQARVDTVNSVTPYGANAFVLAQLGAQFGIPQGTPANPSVYLTFTGTAGYVIPAGFQVTDGTLVYSVQDGATIASSGTVTNVYAVATTFSLIGAIAGAVNALTSSVPSGITLSVTNPTAGTGGTVAESVESYRARVLQAGRIASMGTPAALLTALQALPGVQARLVTVLQVSGGWEVICGGGDSLQIGGAILQSVLDLSTLVGSTTTARNVTVSVNDAGQSYSVVFVNPPQQTVTVAATWNTTQTNFTAGAQVNALAVPAMASYINSIPVGQPINLLELDAVFQGAVASVLPSQYLTTLAFAVTINGASVSPTAGTSIIPGDPESFFYCSTTGASSAQG